MGLGHRLTQAVLRRAAIVTFGVAVAALLVSTACRKPPTDDAPTTSALQTQPPKAAIDQLAPGELVPGPAIAFGIPLPRGAVVQTSTKSNVLAYCEQPFASVDGYMRAHAPGAKIDATAGMVTLSKFPSPTNPAMILEARVDRVSGEKGARIEVRDATPPPPKNLPDDDARLRAVGVDRNGKLADPNMQ